jgi:magnesium transporter
MVSPWSSNNQNNSESRFMNSVINCAAYTNGRRIADVELDRIHEAIREADNFVWLGLHEPEEETLRQVQAEFSLHDLAIEDAHKAHQRPKLEVYGDSLFIVLRTAQVNTQQQVEFGETHFFVGQRYLVSIRHGSSVAYTDVRARCEGSPKLLSKGTGFALYALMDSIVDQYFPIVESLEERLEGLEDLIFDEKSDRSTTEQIYHLKRELLEVKRAISPLIDICNRLMRYDLDVIPKDTQPYFRDVYDHAIRINEMVDNLRELLTTALEANFSLISISQNEVMKRFAGWAAIIAVPTMVAGIYGMNFKFMPELDSPYGYPFVWLIIIGACGGLYWYFHRAGWF